MIKSGQFIEKSEIGRGNWVRYGVAAPAGAGSIRGRVMWINNDRLLYRNFLGAPTTRCFGSLAVYACLKREIHIKIANGEWHAGRLAVVQPYVAHQLAGDWRMITLLTIEPETMEPSTLPQVLRAQGIVNAPDAWELIQQRLDEFNRNGQYAIRDSLDFDQAFFGQPLPGRSLDARIARALENLNDQSPHLSAASDYALDAGLSLSRFLHLFKAETGVAFRQLRRWKRARRLLHVVNHDASLTDVALSMGYSDAAYFSNSIRKVFGLTPKDIFSGSRRLVILSPRRGDAWCDANPLLSPRF